MVRLAYAHPCATAHQPGGKAEKVEWFYKQTLIHLLQITNQKEWKNGFILRQKDYTIQLGQ